MIMDSNKVYKVLGMLLIAFNGFIIYGVLYMFYLQYFTFSLIAFPSEWYELVVEFVLGTLSFLTGFFILKKDAISQGKLLGAGYVLLIINVLFFLIAASL